MARLRHADCPRKCRLFGVDRKCAVDSQKGANDPDVWSGRAVQEVRLSSRCGLASMYPVSDWSSSWLPTIMDISAHAI